jgi:hypothetical protein
MMVGSEGFEPTKALADRFTVCSHWPLGQLPNRIHNHTRQGDGWRIVLIVAPATMASFQVLRTRGPMLRNRTASAPRFGRRGSLTRSEWVRVVASQID